MPAVCEWGQPCLSLPWTEHAGPSLSLTAESPRVSDLPPSAGTRVAELSNCDQSCPQVRGGLEPTRPAHLGIEICGGVWAWGALKLPTAPPAQHPWILGRCEARGCVKGTLLGPEDFIKSQVSDNGGWEACCMKGTSGPRAESLLAQKASQ